MKKHDESLFQIGEVTKILNVTRKALLVYEDLGLLTPAVKDEESGYRYYSADNMTQIRSIRSLQALGLTLKEVGEYYYNADNIDGVSQTSRSALHHQWTLPRAKKHATGIFFTLPFGKAALFESH